MNKWTTSQPTEPGWYWVRDDVHRAFPTRITQKRLDYMHAHKESRFLEFLSLQTIEWAGPIEQPEERDE